MLLMIEGHQSQAHPDHLSWLSPGERIDGADIDDVVTPIPPLPLPNESVRVSALPLGEEPDCEDVISCCG